MAARARMQAFEALGCAGTGKDMEAHRYLYAFAPILSKEQMVLLFDWAMQLRSANEQREIFCRPFFNSMLLDRLISMAERYPQFADISAKLLAAWPAA